MRRWKGWDWSEGLSLQAFVAEGLLTTWNTWNTVQGQNVNLRGKVSACG